MIPDGSTGFVQQKRWPPKASTETIPRRYACGDAGSALDDGVAIINFLSAP